jgi:hypothetical protein
MVFYKKAMHYYVTINLYYVFSRTSRQALVHNNGLAKARVFLPHMLKAARHPWCHFLNQRASFLTTAIIGNNNLVGLTSLPKHTFKA